MREHLSEPWIVIAEPKYAIAEIERRWLVDLSRVGPLDGLPYREIEDLYVSGTQLRLRRILGEGEPVFKFCKKYGKSAGVSEAITNLYLSEAEYKVLARLPGVVVRKLRYAMSGGSLDLYAGSHAGLAVFESEFETETAAAEYSPPSFVGEEITRLDSYSGAALANMVSVTPEVIF